MKVSKPILLLLLVCSFGYSQSDLLKLNLDEEGKTYIKAFLRGQFWARHIEMNPGTTINGEVVNQKNDFSIRRVRVGISAQLTPKLFVFSLLGGNNINLTSEKNFVFDILDFNVEYEFAKEFALGIGESSWYGFSRWIARSSGSLMTLDAPLFSLVTLNKNDDSGRGLGVWAKGQIGKIDYIFSVKNPISYGVKAKENITDFALNNPRMRTSAYLKYEFLDDESNKSAYSGGIGTYMGKKNILNLGIGFLYQPKMTSRLVNGIETYYDFKNWSAELFYDSPINKEKGTSITTYLGYFNTDYGKNYIRNVGANNYTSGGTSFNGSGNSFPMMGTGNTVFFQLGYVLPKSLWKSKSSVQIQPNLAVQFSNFEALNQPMLVYDLGVNVFFKGHANKLSLNYQNRPIYASKNSNALNVNSRKGQLILQYQITVN